MTRRTLLVFVLLILVLSQGYTQQPRPTPPLLGGTSAVPSAPVPSNLIAPQAIPMPFQVAPAPVVEKSLDQLLDTLEALRAQKAELEKKEKELVKSIQQKSDKQAERMKQLGLTPAAATPDRVGRI